MTLDIDRVHRALSVGGIRASLPAAALGLILALFPLVSPSARADINELPPISEGCIASIAGGVGLRDGIKTPAGGIDIDVPGPVVRVIVEWLGRDDADTGVSNLGVAVTGPSGAAADPAVPGTPAGSDNTRIDGTGEEVYAWWADITALFVGGSAGAYNIDIAPFATPGVGISWGAAVTVVYDTTPCAQHSRIIWKIGADYYFGGNNSSSKTSDLIVYEFGVPLPAAVTTSVRMAHGDADHTAGRCRASNIWLATGNGAAPAPGDDLVDQSGNPVHPAAVEAVQHPFTPPSQPCPPPATAPPVTAVTGGNVGPQFGVVDIGLTLPAGAEWIAFQIESPEDNNGRVGLPESGVWGGAGVLTLPSTLPPDPGVALEKTVLAGHGAPCPGTEGVDELVTGPFGTPVTYCFRVLNMGTTPLFPVTITDPALAVTQDDMDLVAGDDTVPLLIGAELVYAYDSAITGDLVNLATVTGVPTDPAGTPLPGVDPVTDDNDAAVDELEAGIELEKTVLAGHGVACPGVQGVDELVEDLAGAPVTYCFRMRNTGDVSLHPVGLDDADLDITDSDMTLVSGDDSVPLPPGGIRIYAYTSVIAGDLVNEATATGTPVDGAGNPIPGLGSVADEDDAAVGELEPGIALEKTVLAGHDAACPGTEGVDEVVAGRSGAEVTYCFRVVNTGEVDLLPVDVTDDTLAVTGDELTVVSGDPTAPLAPGDELVYSWETTITDDLVNTATATGTPVPRSPAAVTAAPVEASNDATVEMLVPDVELEKTVIAGHGAGACPGVEGEDESVIGDVGDPITYCFRVINIGTAALFPVVVGDVPLDITDADMDLVAGDDTVPLLPGEVLVYRYRTTLAGARINVAVVTATPSDGDGNPLRPGGNVSDDNDARVALDADLRPGGGGGGGGGSNGKLPETGASTADQVLLGLGLISLGGATLLFNTLADRRRRQPGPSSEGGPTVHLW